ncbi:discoidin domain-containing protein [Bacteroidota bacterium]
MNKFKFTLVIGLLITITSLLSSQDIDTTLNRVEINGKKVFLSGMNLAWISFANDLTSFNATEFTRALDEISEYHGNALRWWLHVNGTNSPVFDSDGMVTGLNPNEISNLKMALDLAMEKGIVISLCLWSFDMLQEQLTEEVRTRNKNLLEDESKIQSYIDNALIPMVDSLKGHPAIMCWEIFNEPEGMVDDVTWGGWTPVKTSFDPHIQRFINLTAGAIHRTDPNALVSSGCWGFRALTDVQTTSTANKNLYRDDRLIAAGGDSLGVLDFYMIHYYDWAGTDDSPFHHPASYWELNKPLVVAEFSALGPYGDITPTEAYNYLYDNGYAGSLSWTWTGHDNHGGVDDAGPAMEDLYSKYPDDLTIDFGGLVNRSPYPLKNISNIAVPLDFNSDTSYIDLKTIFMDVEQGSDLDFIIQSNSDTDLVQAEVDTNDHIVLFFSSAAVGISTVSVMATDTGGKSAVTFFNIAVYDPTSENKALFKKTDASTIENSGHYHAYAVDGDTLTRWSTEYDDDQWFIVDLDEVYTIQRILLNWEAAFGGVYDIEISEDGESWTTVYQEMGGNGGKDLIVFDPVDARYVKMQGIERATIWGYSIFEIEVYATSINNSAPQLAGTIDDMEVDANSEFEYTISTTLFSDANLEEGDKLVYEALIDDNSELPDWLSFNNYTGVFTGTPTNDNEGTITIKIIASDVFSESDSTTFNLTVNYVEDPPDTSDRIKNYVLDNVQIFPIPADQILNINLPGQYNRYNIELYDILGKVVLNRNNLNSGNKQIEIHNLEKGIYIIKIYSNKESYSQLLMIE